MFNYATNDGVERIQMIIYLINLLTTTSQSKRVIFKYCIYVFLSDILTDNIKNFLVTRLNKLSTK